MPLVPAPATDIDRWFDPSAGGCSAHSSALECAAHLASRYVSGDYTGGLFDPHGHEPANRITRSDLLAVRSLSMWRFGLPTFLRTMGAALDDDAAASNVCTTTACTIHVGCLLRQLPVASSIFTMTPAELAIANGPLWTNLGALFTRTTGKAGTTSLSKTLARKRPALLPILDDIALRRIRSLASHLGVMGPKSQVVPDERLFASLGRPCRGAVRSPGARAR